MENKYTILCDLIRNKKRVAVAFSGGVDSAVLLAVAKEVLPQGTIAIMARLEGMPTEEVLQARKIAEDLDASLVEVDFAETGVEGFCDNPPNRCYLCKRALFSRLKEEARARGCELIEGSNWEDFLSADRPGLRALAEHQIASPLMEARATKGEVRAWATRLVPDVARKPSSPCLSTRVPFGQKITLQKLRQIEQAERFLNQLGFAPVRVRHHEKLAKLEIAASCFAKLGEEKTLELIHNHLKTLGFEEIVIDPNPLKRN